MSTTERSSIQSWPAHALAVAAIIAVTYWLLVAQREDPTDHHSINVQTSLPSEISSKTSAAVHTATGSPDQRHPDSARSAAAHPPPLRSFEADIPAYETHPTDVIVEIGAPIDVDNPPLDEVSLNAQAIHLGPPLDADDPFNGVQNSSTEIIAIGEALPTDEQPQ